MIEAMKQFRHWMDEHGISLDDVALTIHFPDEKRRCQFSCALQREVSVFKVNKISASLLHELRLFGTDVHLRLGE